MRRRSCWTAACSCSCNAPKATTRLLYTGNALSASLTCDAGAPGLLSQNSPVTAPTNILACSSSSLGNPAAEASDSESDSASLTWARSKLLDDVRAAGEVLWMQVCMCTKAHPMEESSAGRPSM